MTTHTVGVVVDRNFGDRLLPIVRRLHVWVCDTPANREAAERAWASIPTGAVWNEAGATTFKVSENDSPVDMVLDRLTDIDLHHGEYSHDPAWSVVEVYGSKPIAALQQALQEFGVDTFRETPGGFVCSRPLNSAHQAKENA